MAPSPEAVINMVSQRALAGSSPPLIVVGSGLSAAEGISTMSQLGDCLSRHVQPQAIDSDAWQGIKDDMSSIGLELALQRHPVSDDVLEQIVSQTHKLIASDDYRIFIELATGRKRALALSRLFTHLFTATAREIHVVTTNYDCLVEYASETAGFPCDAGFTGQYIRRRHTISMKSTNNRQAKRVILAKVHGSVDWFRQATNLYGLSLGNTVPEELKPVIVTPGLAKYKETHQEPFRSVLQAADDAARSAKSALCIGYGFSDEHIHPVLAERAARGELNIVILAMKLTETAREFIKNHCKSEYLAIEKSEQGSIVYCSELSEPIEVNQPLWQLPTFIDGCLV